MHLSKQLYRLDTYVYKAFAILAYIAISFIAITTNFGVCRAQGAGNTKICLTNRVAFGAYANGEQYQHRAQ
ncbi:MAG: hypothetical protein ACK5BG_01730, partial [Pseudanabaena sp.]